MENRIEALILAWSPEDLLSGPDELHDPRATRLSKWNEPVPSLVMQGLLDSIRPDNYILMVGYTNFIPQGAEWREEDRMVKEIRIAPNRMGGEIVTHLIHRLDTIDFSVLPGTATMSEALLSLRPDGTPMLKILGLSLAAYFRVGSKAFESRLTNVLISRNGETEQR
jgi:hypothetical protein